MAIRSAPLLLLLAMALPAGCGTPAVTTPAAALPTGQPPAPGPRGISLAMGSETPRLAVLLQEQGARRLWRSADGIAVQTDGPRITATSGLAQVIMATRIDGADPLAAPLSLLGGEAAARRLVDLATAARDPAGMRFGAEIACRLRATAQGPDAIDVEESCDGGAGIGRFTNRFTLRRDDAALLASTQWIGPGLPPLATGPIP